MIAMAYGTVYVARVSLANPAQCIKALLEAEAYDGPSLVIAYAHCIAHGIDMMRAVDDQKKAVNSGYWTLFRYNPDLVCQGQNPLQFDSKQPTISFDEYALAENRYRVLKKNNPQAAATLMQQASEWTARRFDLYEKMAAMTFSVCPVNKAK